MRRHGCSPGIRRTSLSAPSAAPAPSGIGSKSCRALLDQSRPGLPTHPPRSNPGGQGRQPAASPAGSARARASGDGVDQSDHRLPHRDRHDRPLRGRMLRSRRRPPRTAEGAAGSPDALLRIDRRRRSAGSDARPLAQGARDARVTLRRHSRLPRDTTRRRRFRVSFPGRTPNPETFPRGRA
jgi:hypothetical protein